MSTGYSADAPSGLMRLSLELRRKVYRYLILPTKPLLLYEEITTEDGAGARDWNTYNPKVKYFLLSHHSILVLNKQLNREILEVFYHEAIFLAEILLLDSRRKFGVWFASEKNNIKHLHLSMRMPPNSSWQAPDPRLGSARLRSLIRGSNRICFTVPFIIRERKRERLRERHMFLQRTRVFLRDINAIFPQSAKIKVCSRLNHAYATMRKQFAEGLPGRTIAWNSCYGVE